MTIIGAVKARIKSIDRRYNKILRRVEPKPIRKIALSAARFDRKIRGRLAQVEAWILTKLGLMKIPPPTPPPRPPPPGPGHHSHVRITWEGIRYNDDYADGMITMSRAEYYRHRHELHNEIANNLDKDETPPVNPNSIEIISVEWI